MPERISAATVRYIKLGPGNRWFESCLKNQRIELGHALIDHDEALRGDWDRIIQQYHTDHGYTAGKAKDLIREARDFYELGADCLWITIADGRLWWANAEPEVTWLGGEGETHGVRARATLEPWRDTDIEGTPLDIDRLSTKLTQVAAYRQTLCQVKEADYCVRKINAETEPVVIEARSAFAALCQTTERMIADLHWADFELLVDLIFTKAGWQRISAVGGAMKDIDLALEQPATGERAFVQVKSTADAGVYRDYCDRFGRTPGYDRMFFVCHSPRGVIDERPDAPIWAGPRLAEMTVKAGLFDWLLQRVG